MVCNVKERYQNLARKLENYHLKNFKLFYEQTWERSCTEYTLKSLHWRVHVDVHTCADTCTYMPLLLLLPSKTQPLTGGQQYWGANKVSAVDVKRADWTITFGSLVRYPELWFFQRSSVWVCWCMLTAKTQKLQYNSLEELKKMLSYLQSL